MTMTNCTYFSSYVYVSHVLSAMYKGGPTIYIYIYINTNNNYS